MVILVGQGEKGVKEAPGSPEGSRGGQEVLCSTVGHVFCASYITTTIDIIIIITIFIINVISVIIALWALCYAHLISPSQKSSSSKYVTM